MTQIILIITAIALGLITGRLTGGFAFSPAVCLIAGIFLVTPSLFKFKLADLSLIKSHVPEIGKNLWVNYLLLTAVSLLVGFASQDIGIAAALFLLALLPGGGMVMMWIKSSGANVKLGFIIFMLNLALLLPITLIFSQYYGIAAPYFPPVDLGNISGLSSGATVKPVAPFMLLVVIPFIVSRIVLRFFPVIVGFAGKHQPKISKATMFGIVFYLFSLSTSQLLFKVSLAELLTAAIATIVFYGITVAVALFFTDRTATGKAVFWHIATRYITLALILAVFNVDVFGATFILPIMMAYFIQIGSAGFLAKIETRPAATTAGG